MTAVIIYGLCTITAFLCCFLLAQAYGRSRYRLLLWGSLCFAGLTLNNALVIADKFIIHDYDLGTWRLAAAFLGMSVLLYGLIWDKE